jgi:hypothetical protein
MAAPSSWAGTRPRARTHDTDSSHRFDPITETVSPGPRLAFSAEVDLTMLVLGGLQASAATDVFDPTAGLWQPGPILEPAWGASTATLLRNGRVLVFGGEGAQGFPVSTVILYE